MLSQIKEEFVCFLSQFFLRCLFDLFFVNHLYRIGTTKSVNIVLEIIPPINVQPKGDHKVVPENVRGINPKIVVKDVNTIGVKRVLAASLMASIFSIPSEMS